MGGAKTAKKITTIKVSKETRDKLAELGNKGETFDEILQKLLKHYKK
jgi:hypothetical protein